MAASTRRREPGRPKGLPDAKGMERFAKETRLRNVRRVLPVEQRSASERYHAAHPDVYDQYVAIARELKQAYRRYSSQGIMHVIRWERRHSAVGEQPFEVNNNFSPWYARKLMAEHPDEFAGFFELRELKAD